LTDMITILFMGLHL